MEIKSFIFTIEKSKKKMGGSCIFTKDKGQKKIGRQTVEIKYYIFNAEKEKKRWVDERWKLKFVSLL